MSSLISGRSCAKKFTGRQRRGPKGQSPKGQARDGVLGEGVSSQKDPTPCCQVINRECQISRCPKEETKKRIHVAGIYKKPILLRVAY